MNESRILSIEEALRDSPITYFADLHNDERLDTLLAPTLSETNFTFTGSTNRHIWKDVLEPNAVHRGTHEYTKFMVEGQLSNLGACTEMTMSIDAVNDDPLRREQGMNVEVDIYGMAHLTDKYSSQSLQLSPEQFIDFSLRVANASKTQSRDLLKQLENADETLPKDYAAFCPYWIEQAEKSGGTTREVRFIEAPLLQKEPHYDGARLAQIRTETNDTSEVQLIIEHTNSRFDTDHEVVNRLELEYSSAVQHADKSKAERRVYESCALELSRARLFSDNLPTYVTGLDALDPELLAQFRSTVELLIASGDTTTCL